MRTVTEALDISARLVQQQYSIRVAYIFDAYCEFGVESIRGTLDHALQHPPANLVGFGLGGIEQSRLPYQRELRDVFRAAVKSGPHSVPHAGEMTGPEMIWEALDGLGAERIGRCPSTPSQRCGRQACT